MTLYKYIRHKLVLFSKLDKALPKLFFILIIHVYSPGILAAWAFSVSESNGLPQLSVGGETVMNSDYVFWGQDWKWARLRSRFEIEAPMKYSVSGVNRQLDFKLESGFRKISDNQARWTFELDALKTTPGAIGGGISFKFNFRPLVKVLGKPELLPDDRGWVWGARGKDGLKIEFEPGLESLHFEGEKKSEIRAFFYKGQVPEGQRSYTMTITLFGNIGINPTLSERFDISNSSTLTEDLIDWETFPVDLSFLNAAEKPAGKHGFLEVDGENLVFENGKRVRFWGTNISARTLFKTSNANVSRQAKRLSAMGFNLVRLHHHDSAWVNPNVFGQKPVIDTQALSQSALNKIDWWIKSLKDEGIYVWLDLHVGRKVTEHDGIYAFDEINRRSKKEQEWEGSKIPSENARRKIQGLFSKRHYTFPCL